MARQRITDNDLDSLCTRINELTGSPLQSWGVGGAQVGNYHTSHAYGGVQLQRMHSTGGATTSPIGGGFGTKRELYERLCAYVAGLETTKGE